jgi:hypothetical protein
LTSRKSNFRLTGEPWGAEYVSASTGQPQEVILMRQATLLTVVLGGLLFSSGPAYSESLEEDLQGAANYLKLKRPVSSEDMYKIVTLFAENMSRHLPRTIDKITTLDSVRARPPNILIYKYRVDVKGELNKEKFQTFLNTLVKSQTCTAPATASMLRRGISIGNEYSRTDGAYIAGITFSPKDCGVKVSPL